MKKISYLEIFLAQGGNCFYCGKPMKIYCSQTMNDIGYTKDHFYPKRKGNSLNGNVVLAHSTCNHQKGDSLPTRKERERFKTLYRKINKRKRALNKTTREIAQGIKQQGIT